MQMIALGIGSGYTQAVQLNSKGNLLLGAGNPYNGLAIPGFSSFTDSAQGRVPAASEDLWAAQSCNSLFNASPSKSYIDTYTRIQPRLGIAYQLDEKSVLRAGVGRFVTRMPLLDNISPAGILRSSRSYGQQRER